MYIIFALQMLPILALTLAIVTHIWDITCLLLLCNGTLNALITTPASTASLVVALLLLFMLLVCCVKIYPGSDYISCWDNYSFWLLF